MQKTSTSSDVISGKNEPTSQSKQSETFCKELAKADKRSYDTGYSRRLRNPFYFAAKAIKATKFASDLVDQEVQDMLRKDARVVSHPKEDTFPSSMFLVKKEEEERGRENVQDRPE